MKKFEYNIVIFLIFIQQLIFCQSLAQDEHLHHMMMPMQNSATENAYPAEAWQTMFHGYAQLVCDRQNGRRGGRQLFVSGMFGWMAERPWSEGTVILSSMFSPDPFMGAAGYPLLLQTGETADGQKQLLDRQHPHDFFSELSLGYTRPLSQETELLFYAGLPGEPALGPPAFMHRLSGTFLPEAPLTHHWFDSTHITFGVATIGYRYRQLKFELSGFNGREPDERRYDIESGPLDSSSWRLTWTPAAEWSIQGSQGYLREPEQTHPELDLRRTTISLIY